MSNINAIYCELYCLDMFFMMAVHFHGPVFDLKRKAIIDLSGFFFAGLYSGVNFLALFFERGKGW